MRVNSISASVYPHKLQKRASKKINEEGEQTVMQQTFRGGLKLPDYIAGGICGTAVGVVVSAAICPPIGILAGIFGAKILAEANRDSRPSKDNED